MNSYGEGETWEEYDKYTEVYKPYFNNEVVTKHWDKEKFKSAVAELDIRKIIGTEYEKALIKWGENEGGLLVEDMAAVRKATEDEAQRKVAAAEEPVKFYQGYFGLRISNRLPAAIWNKVREHATFIKGDESDMETLDDQGYYDARSNEVRGWVYDEEVIDILFKEGMKIQYRGEVITSSDECALVDKRIKDANLLIEAKAKEINSYYAQFQTRIMELKDSGKYASREEAEAASHLPVILIPGWEGANIYGGGKWLHIKDDDLYLVYNNGHDGDNWGRNNYVTGGAGAICYKAAGAAGIVKEIEDWLISIGSDTMYIKS